MGNEANPEPIIYKLEIQGDGKVVAGATNVSNAIGQLGPKASPITAVLNQYSVANTNASKSSEVLSNNVLRIAPAMQLLGRNIQGLGININDLTGQLGASASAAQGIMAALGVGTGVGIAAAGLIAGIGYLAKNYESAADKLAKLNKESVKSVKTMKEQRLAELDLQIAQRERGALWEKLNTLEATQADFDRARREIALGNLNVTEETIKALEEETKQYQERNKALKEIADAEKSLERERRASGTGAASIDSFKLTAENERKIRAINGMIEKSDADESKDALASYLQYHKDVESEKRAWTQETVEFQKRQYEEDVEAHRKAQEEKTKQAEENATLQKELAFQSFAIVANVGAKSLQDVVKGKKLEAGAIIESIGDSLFADGTANVLKAAALAWIPGYGWAAAGPLAAAGAAEIATGLAMGAAGARMTGGSQAGGKGGGAATPAAGTELGRQSDQYSNIPTTSGAPVVINISTLNPSREAGVAIYDSMRAAYLADTSLSIKQEMISP